MSQCLCFINCQLLLHSHGVCALYNCQLLLCRSVCVLYNCQLLLCHSVCVLYNCQLLLCHGVCALYNCQLLCHSVCVLYNCLSCCCFSFCVVWQKKRSMLGRERERGNCRYMYVCFETASVMTHPVCAVTQGWRRKLACLTLLRAVWTDARRAMFLPASGVGQHPVFNRHSNHPVQ